MNSTVESHGFEPKAETLHFIQELIPLAWIGRVIIGLIGLSITGTILRIEIRKRQSSEIHFVSKYLRFTSAGCFWCGPISSLLLIFSVIPGFCMIRFSGSVIVHDMQFVFMSCYQLSRLHYCFSNQQLRTNTGYPPWLFVMMITIGIIIWISCTMMHILVDTLPTTCGYTNDLFFFYQYRGRTILFDGDSFRDEWMERVYFLWYFSVATATHIWDLAILLLYLFKIWKIGKIHKSKRDGVWDNVLFVLHRIVIITVFYTIFSLSVPIIFTVLSLIEFSEDDVVNAIIYELRTSALVIIRCIALSFSIFVMMDHNTNIYIDFLHFLHRFRLKYCCFCCFNKMVDRQLQTLEREEDVRALGEPSSLKVDGTDDMESTWFPNLSINVVYTSDTSPKELILSPATVTRINYGDGN